MRKILIGLVCVSACGPATHLGDDVVDNLAGVQIVGHDDVIEVVTPSNLLAITPTTKLYDIPTTKLTIASLKPSAAYYLYGKPNGSDLTLYASDAPPNLTTRTAANGDYLVGSFATRSDGRIMDYTQTGRMHRLTFRRLAGLGVGENEIVDVASPLTFEHISVGYALPTGAMQPVIAIQVVGFSQEGFGSISEPAAEQPSLQLAVVKGSTATDEVQMTSNRFKYAVNGTGVQLSAWLVGYQL